jgi:hypothetical protein
MNPNSLPFFSNYPRTLFHIKVNPRVYDSYISKRQLYLALGKLDEVTSLIVSQIGCNQTIFKASFRYEILLSFSKKTNEEFIFNQVKDIILQFLPGDDFFQIPADEIDNLDDYDRVKELIIGESLNKKDVVKTITGLDLDCFFSGELPPFNKNYIINKWALENVQNNKKWSKDMQFVIEHKAWGIEYIKNKFLNVYQAHLENEYALLKERENAERIKHERTMQPRQDTIPSTYDIHFLPEQTPQQPIISPEPVTQHEIIDLTTTPSQQQLIEASFSRPFTMPDINFTGSLEDIDLGISPKKITPLEPRFNHLIFSSIMRNLNKKVSQEQIPSQTIINQTFETTEPIHIIFENDQSSQQIINIIPPSQQINHLDEPLPYNIRIEETQSQIIYEDLSLTGLSSLNFSGSNVFEINNIVCDTQPDTQSDYQPPAKRRRYN